MICKILKDSVGRFLQYIGTPSGNIRSLLILFLLSAVLRAVLLAYTPEEVLFHNDGHEYMDISRQIAEGNGFSISYRRWYEASSPSENRKIHTDYSRTPFFPLLGSLLFFLPIPIVTGVKIMCWLLALLAIFTVFLLAKEAAGRSAGFFTALIFSVYPYNLYYSVCWSTEMTFLILLCFSLYYLLLVCKKHFRLFLPCFCLLALAVLTRPTAILLFPCFLAVVIWRIYRQWKKYTDIFVKYAILGTLVFSAVLLPWAIRNGVHTGIYTPLCFYNQYVFWLSNSKIIEKTYQTLDTPAYASTVDEAWKREHEEKTSFLGRIHADSLIKANPYWKQWGHDQVRENPDRMIYLLKKRFFHYWRMCPNLVILTPAKIVLLRIFFTVMYFFALLGLLTCKRRFFACLMLGLPLFGLVISIPFLFVLRYRFPFFAPFLCFFAAEGILWCLHRLCKHI